MANEKLRMSFHHHRRRKTGLEIRTNNGHVLQPWSVSECIANCFACTYLKTSLVQLGNAPHRVRDWTLGFSFAFGSREFSSTCCPTYSFWATAVVRILSKLIQCNLCDRRTFRHLLQADILSLTERRADAAESFPFYVRFRWRETWKFSEDV